MTRTQRRLTDAEAGRGLQIEPESPTSSPVPGTERRARRLGRADRRTRRLVLAGVFLAVLGVYDASPVQQVLDSSETILIAQNIVKHGSVSLQPYRNQLPSVYPPVWIRGQAYPWFPLGEPFLAVPFVAGADFFHQQFGVGPRLDDSKSIISSNWLQVAVASTIAAATAAMVFLLAELGLERLAQRRRRLWAFGVAMVFAFGTAAWSTASRALWEHGPSMLCLSVATYLAMRSRRNPSMVRWLGLPLGAAYFMRPTNAIPIGIFTVWVAVYHRRHLPAYGAGLGLLLGLFVFVSENSYHSIVPPYYSAGQLSRLTGWPGTPLLGELVSPSWGLFIFAPVTLLAIAGAVVSFRRRSVNNVDVAIASIVVVYWWTVAAWPDWGGGYAYGPRFMSEMLPFLVVIALPAVAWLAQATRGPQRTAAVSGTAVLVTASILFNLGGAWSDRAMQWNSDLPLTVHRLWSWNDPQFLRGLPFAPHTYYAQLLAILATVGVGTALVMSMRQIIGGRGRWQSHLSASSS